MKRIKLSKRANKANFKRTAMRTHKKNIYLSHPRGGIRL